MHLDEWLCSSNYNYFQRHIYRKVYKGAQVAQRTQRGTNKTNEGDIV